MPLDAGHAYELDRLNGNDHWQKAIEKEMCNVGVAFEILNDDQVAPMGWKHVTGHLVFDVKMSFERKARWVLDGHKKPDPLGSTHAGLCPVKCKNCTYICSSKQS